jgi:hypothetical protein
MEDPGELALVIKALTSGLSNCVEWASDRLIWRVRSDPRLCGLTPEGIKRELLNYIRAGGVVKQVEETRPEYQGLYRYYYKAIIPVVGFPKGIFIEMVLQDGDPDVPSVSLVNAHPQSR